MDKGKMDVSDLLATLDNTGISKKAAKEIAANASSGHWTRARQLLYAQRAELVHQVHAAQEILYRIDHILQSWKGENA